MALFLDFRCPFQRLFQAFREALACEGRGVLHVGREFGYIILGGQTLAEAETAPLPAGPANRSSAHFSVDLLSGLTGAQILELDFVMSGSFAVGIPKVRVRCMKILDFLRMCFRIFKVLDLLEVGEHLALLDDFVQGGGASDQGHAGVHEH